jgi:hypothetical protein
VRFSRLPQEAYHPENERKDNQGLSEPDPNLLVHLFLLTSITPPRDASRAPSPSPHKRCGTSPLGSLVEAEAENVRSVLGDAELAEKAGGSAWESNPPPTPQPAPDNGFEDRRRHQPPSASEGILADSGRPAGVILSRP